LPPDLILLLAADMKCAAAALMVSLALTSQAFAMLRPMFPVKADPPFLGGTIVIGDDTLPSSGEKAAPTAPK
jgi:hypothetical protein